MFEDLRGIVVEQGDLIGEYEENIEKSAQHTSRAVKDLAEGQQAGKYSNVKLLVVAMLIFLLLLIIWKI